MPGCSGFRVVGQGSAREVMSRNLCLVGMMGVGKSTVATLLGDRLGRRVADTDDEIRRWTG